jgi:hypothetical protein
MPLCDPNSDCSASPLSVGDMNKRKMALSGDAKVALKGADSASGTGTGTGILVYQLLCVGQSRAVHPAVRWLCLSLTGSLVKAEHTGAAMR